MSRIPDLKLISKDEFDSKDQKLVDKLAYPINAFMQQTINIFKKGIDFTNLNQELVTITVSVNELGIPAGTTQFRSSLLTKIAGLQCINILNKTNSINYPTAQPFITFSQNGSLVTITHIAGLTIPSGQTVSDTYQFTVLSIGTSIPTA